VPSVPEASVHPVQGHSPAARGRSPIGSDHVAPLFSILLESPDPARNSAHPTHAAAAERARPEPHPRGDQPCAKSQRPDHPEKATKSKCGKEARETNAGEDANPPVEAKDPPADTAETAGTEATDAVESEGIEASEINSDVLTPAAEIVAPTEMPPAVPVTTTPVPAPPAPSSVISVGAGMDEITLAAAVAEDGKPLDAAALPLPAPESDVPQAPPAPPAKNLGTLVAAAVAEVKSEQSAKVDLAAGPVASDRAATAHVHSLDGISKTLEVPGKGAEVSTLPTPAVVETAPSANQHRAEFPLPSEPPPRAAEPTSTLTPAPLPSAAPGPAATPAPPLGNAVTPAAPVPIAGLAVEIAARAQSGKNHFKIRLDPPELGRIDVRLDVDRDGNVTSRLVVERTETLDLLRRDAPNLERAFQQAGLKTSDNSLQFSLRDQSSSGRDNAGQAPTMARIVVDDDGIAPVETSRNYARLGGLGSGVDIRV
jgi:hypothetical protein